MACGGSQARSKLGNEYPKDKGEDLRSSGEGLRGFESHPPH